MAMPIAVTRWNKRVVNPVLIRLAGHGWFVELEHVGRRTGRVRRVPLMAFRSGTAQDPTVTIALTYGPRVDWLRNLTAAGGGRMRLGDEVLQLGPPRELSTDEGIRRMPWPPRAILPLTGVTDFVELPVRSHDRVDAGWAS